MLGGLESISAMLAEAFTAHGQAVTVFTETKAASEFVEQVGFNVTRGVGVVQLFRRWRDYDVILFMGLSLRALPWAVLSGRPVVVSHHGVYTGENFFSRLLGAFKRACTLCFRNICVSHFVAGHIPAKSVVIHNAYDHEVFINGSSCPRDRALVFCGRLVSDKGAELLIRALGIVLRKLSDVTLTIIGDGPERCSLEALTDKLGIGAKIDFVGWRRGSDLASLLGQHRVMVVPSLWEEPFGIVALEGLACGCRLVVTDRGGLPEAAGPWGRKCNPNSESIADAILDELVADVAPDPSRQDGVMQYLRDHRKDQVGDRYLTVLAHAAKSDSRKDRV
jgi:glycosyltransferase involved in cell wall biosynthesis